MSSSSTRSLARRSHKKVRTGCATCKRRKIKCDEHKPQCHNCTRHDVACTFAYDPLEAVSPSTPYMDSLTGPTGSVLAHRHHVPAASDSRNSAAPPMNINSLYLKLLHHYTTVTSYTLSPDPLLRTLWRREVPQLAFDHDFLMRGIFALSAIHLSRLAPQKEEYYLSIAREEHHIALPQATALLSNITAENCSALYAFSILTFLYAWASPRRPGDIPLLHNPGAAEWLGLFRGIRSIGEVARDDLYNGPIGPFIRLGAQRIEYTAAPLRSSTWWARTPEKAKLDQLRQHLTTTVSDPDIMDVYSASIDDLETSFCSLALSANDVHPGQHSTFKPDDELPFPRHRLPESSAIYAWLYKASEKYLELLSHSEQEALVIFAYFGVALKSLEPCWWGKGWSEHILSAIWNLLEPEYRLWIQWPMEEIGWTAEEMQ